MFILDDVLIYTVPMKKRADLCLALREFAKEIGVITFLLWLHQVNNQVMRSKGLHKSVLCL